MNNKHICFLMPFFNASCPIGGLKIVLQYANFLAEDGYKVTVVYPWKLAEESKDRFYRRWNHFYRHFPREKTVWQSSDNWFAKHKNVREVVSFNLEYKYVPKADIYIATGVETSDFVCNYPVEEKYYLIQGYENWGRSDEELIKTYHHPLKKIAISRWLQKVVLDNNEECDFVPNGYELDKFYIVKPIEERDKYCISMLGNNAELKNNLLAHRALELVHQKYPQLKVNIFGASKRSVNLPAWYHYIQKPSPKELLDLYNESSIFIGTSNIEGWGLTVGEAMLCGNAIACSDIAGYREMVTDGETGLLSPVNDAEKMAENIIRLIENDELRWSMAKAGNANVRQFTFEHSYELFKKALHIQ